MAQLASARALGARGCRFESCFPDQCRPHRLTVRTAGFHPVNRSSILRGVTKEIQQPFMVAETLSQKGFLMVLESKKLIIQ